MSPAIAHLGHIALDTPDIERSLAFFRDLLGLEEVERDGDAVYLRCYQELDHHSLVLREGPTAVDHVGWRVAAPEDVGGFADRIRATGVEVTDAPQGRGHGEAIRFLTPHGEHPFELYYDVERPLAAEHLRSELPSNSSKRRGLGARRIDHVNLATRYSAVGQAEEWLTEQLGFNRREYIQDGDEPPLAAWLSVTPQVHDVAIQADLIGDQAGRFNHVAFTVEDYNACLSAADILRDHGVQIDLAPGKHGIGQAMYLYFRDPGSGHRIELYGGGYLIFAPDWTPIRWTRETLMTGFAWYGPGIELDPSHPMTETTPCKRGS